jgi:hypothetical protein
VQLDLDGLGHDPAVARESLERVTHGPAVSHGVADESPVADGKRRAETQAEVAGGNPPDQLAPQVFDLGQRDPCVGIVQVRVEQSGGREQLLRPKALA